MPHSVHSSANSISPVSSNTASAGFLLSLMVAAAAFMAGLGNRWDLWDLSTSLFLIRSAVVVGIVSAAVSLAGVVITRPGTQRCGFRHSVFGLAVSIIIVAVPLNWHLVARDMPMINDITTDMEDPPQFVSILPIREKFGANPASYGGSEVAAQQRAAYPDIKPITLMLPPDRTLDRALATARSLGWTIVHKNMQEGRIEAMDATFWFGFIDDIVIRVRSENNGSRVDVRSVSRVGVSDGGTNAARIRMFMKKLADS